MRLNVDEHRDIEFREVYNGVLFVTAEGNRYGICMRDDTIEVIVNGDAPEPRIFKHPMTDDTTTTDRGEPARAALTRRENQYTMRYGIWR